MIQAYHKFPPDPEPFDYEQWKTRPNDTDTYRIATIYISEKQALKIVRRLWPNEGLLGATCGRAFRIDSAEKASVVNEVLAPYSSIDFNPEKHNWALQTWPE